MDRVTGDAAWAEALVAAMGPDRAEAARAYGATVPAGYRERVQPGDAAWDLESILVLESGIAGDAGACGGAGVFLGSQASGDRTGGPHRIGVRPGRSSLPGSFRLRRVATESVELSELLPLMESFGLVVVEAFPQWIDPPAGSIRPWHIDDIGVRLPSPPSGPDPRFDPAADGDRLLHALEAVADRAADVDSLNRLVLAAGLGWRQVVVVRAYRRYLHQAGCRWSPAELDDALAGYPLVARALDGFISARFDPGSVRTAAESRRTLLDAVGEVTHLQQDQILRLFVGLVDATVRTNVFTGPSPFAPGRAVAIQLDSARVPGLAPPRPRVETFVHGPAVEGIHLRNGLIARGGLRWSDRPDDFRTEVLDLAQAQVKKNAIIVPTGAKGGFVVRSRVVDPAGGPVASAAIQAAYEVFVGSLLDITDNVVGGRVVHPAGVVADLDDPYLVVAADRGTSTFSDVANAISEQRSFWLGDAFASGGSRGYDHKALGITARGAWVAVRRHFHQLGLDPQAEPVRAVGVGDMSGDVFGNGMLMSETLRLVAAFDHRHVFVDPDPDPARSFAERRRLARMAGSSWDDYDRSALSRGAGIWSRETKAIELSPPARRALGVDAEMLTPPELIAAILAAPVDLLWFGGIGTYVRAPDESDTDVGDRANDAVRITSNQLRARVVAEGGNLGVTQRARIRYSRRGGRINTDFIDNAAGVAISDREVNLKILLALAIEEGRLDAEGRDQLLAAVTADVVEAVLQQVDNSVVALSRAVPTSAGELDAYEALIGSLQRGGYLDRAVEALPDADELATRRTAGAGLIRPELAVLLAYAKSALVADIEASELPGDPALVDSVSPYFPPAIRDQFAASVTRHRLYRELVATDVAGEVVDQMGVTWAHETAAALNRSRVDVAAAFWAAREVLGAGPRWEKLVRSTAGVFAPGADLDLEAHRVVVTAVDVVARRYLARPGPVRPGAVIANDRAVAEALAAGPLRAAGTAERDRLVGLGADEELAEDLARWAAAADVADVSAICRSLGGQPLAVADVLVAIDDAAGLGPVVAAARAAGAAGSRWASWQAEALAADVRAWRHAATVSLIDIHGHPDAARDAIASWRAEGAFVGVDALRSCLGTRDDLIVATLAVRSLPFGP
ncbi:MAG: NAD-glutamate dehydrogenase domain-containing protein [Acidimicrobiales bacterium]